VNRRLSLVLSVAAIASLTTGCATFSDSSNVARVGDATLTDDDFQAQLTELGAPTDQLLPAEAVRAQITTWIQEQVAAGDGDGVSADQVAALYDEGIEASGTVCINGIVVEQEDTATRISGELADGGDFAALLDAENLDATLGEAGGDVGCITSDQVAEAGDVEFVQVAATLAAGNPIGTAPLFDQLGNPFGWVVLQFRTFDTLSPTDAASVAATIDSAARLADADVYVDPRYGTFDAASGQVVALG
jgi:hypothetical protein